MEHAIDSLTGKRDRIAIGHVAANHLDSQRLQLRILAAREPRANAAFLRLPRGGNHHDLGLFGVGPSAPPKQRGGIGLYHLAWQLDTIDELAAARQVLLDSGAYTGESSHGATKSLYAADPDGNELELMWMLPREDWGDFADSATVERLDLAAELERWSGVSTA